MFRPLLASLLLFSAPALAQERDDPMRPTGRAAEVARLPGVTAVARSNGWKLDATLIGAAGARAIINGRTVTVGEVVNGARVTEILPGKVWMRRDDSTFLLPLVETESVRGARPGGSLKIKKPSGGEG